jgi:hypothetical protein
MHQFSDTELGQASLISKLSGRPHPVRDDIFAWNGKIIDRATAVVALLKVYNHVPVGDSVKMAMFEKYTKRFNTIRHRDFFVDVYTDDTKDPSTESKIWFNKICFAVKGDATELPKEAIKDILITLHS